MRQLMVLFMLVISLTGCGFHLRGQMPLATPLHVVYLKTPNPYGQLAHNLQQSFKMSGTRLVDNPNDATAILNILKEETSQQLLGINGSQQTRQYNLILTVTFEVTTPSGQTTVSPQVITETRTLTIQADQMLASSNESNSLYQQMRSAIVYKIMRRLASEEVTTLLMRNSA